MCSRILSLTIVCALIATAISHQSFQNGPRFVQQGPAINYQKPNIPQQVLPRGAQTQGFAPQQVVPFRPQLVARGACTAIGGCGSSPAMDFNQLLLGGSRGYAGMKARVNARGFQYASSIIGNLLNDEIRRAKIPAISQCIKEVNGCIQIYNIFVSRYRCPERIAIYPAPPNRIVISVQNLDIGITGNLGGIQN
uniref:BPI1 domain-containing protein n=1 Tax=Rhabditophanes sp. KR3021 TaxID=114890 RepID=A0AC35TLS0_9BILA